MRREASLHPLDIGLARTMERIMRRVVLGHGLFHKRFCRIKHLSFLNIGVTKASRHGGSGRAVGPEADGRLISDGSASLTMAPSTRLLTFTLVAIFFSTLCLAKDAKEPLVVRVRPCQNRVFY